MQEINLTEIDRQIRLMRQAVADLEPVREQFPALDKNLTRLSASLKMLELNISDVIAVGKQARDRVKGR